LDKMVLVILNELEEVCKPYGTKKRNLTKAVKEAIKHKLLNYIKSRMIKGEFHGRRFT